MRSLLERRITQRGPYQLSELGLKMTRSSHWMTVLVTDFLIAKGVSLESIIWNLSEASEEVDCMVQFHDKQIKNENEALVRELNGLIIMCFNPTYHQKKLGYLTKP